MVSEVVSVGSYSGRNGGLIRIMMIIITESKTSFSLPVRAWRKDYVRTR